MTYLMVKEGWPFAQARITELSALLASRGFITALHEDDRDGTACMEVSSARGSLIGSTEHVFVAPDGTGEWWFWWPWRAPIAAAGDVLATADIVARQLGDGHG